MDRTKQVTIKPVQLIKSESKVSLKWTKCKWPYSNNKSYFTKVTVSESQNVHQSVNRNYAYTEKQELTHEAVSKNIKKICVCTLQSSHYITVKVMASHDKT